MSKRISRINSVKNLTFILSAVLGQVSKSAAYNMQEQEDCGKVFAHSRGWLNTFRWAAFKLAFLIPLAFLGLVTVSGSQEVALRVYVSDRRFSFRNVNLNDMYTRGSYEAWLGWDRELLAEVVANANKRSKERMAVVAV
jgi:hypothetical protein